MVAVAEWRTGQSWDVTVTAECNRCQVMTDAIDELIERNLAMIPEGIRAKELLQMVYRGLIQLTPQQMRAAEKCLEFEEPKVSAVAVGHFDGKDFATQLEKAIQRSQQPPPPAALAPPQHPASELKGNFPVRRRNLR